jgi:hypothetical protein
VCQTNESYTVLRIHHSTPKSNMMGLFFSRPCLGMFSIKQNPKVRMEITNLRSASKTRGCTYDTNILRLHLSKRNLSGSIIEASPMGHFDFVQFCSCFSHVHSLSRGLTSARKCHFHQGQQAPEDSVFVPGFAPRALLVFF